MGLNSETTLNNTMHDSYYVHFCTAHVVQ